MEFSAIFAARQRELSHARSWKKAVEVWSGRSW